VPPHKRLLNAPADTGLPIGNLSSQFFANVLLNVLDQHVKHQLQGALLRPLRRRLLPARRGSAAPEWARTRTSTALAAGAPALPPEPAQDGPAAVDRGIDFVGHVIKPWRRTTRPRTVARAIERLRTMDRADVFTAGNSYLGLVGQASHPHRERARIAKVLLKRGHVAKGDFSKIYRSPACPLRTSSLSCLIDDIVREILAEVADDEQQLDERRSRHIRCAWHCTPATAPIASAKRRSMTSCAARVRERAEGWPIVAEHFDEGISGSVPVGLRAVARLCSPTRSQRASTS
jgi:hypothetical protein